MQQEPLQPLFLLEIILPTGKNCRLVGKTVPGKPGNSLTLKLDSAPGNPQKLLDALNKAISQSAREDTDVPITVEDSRPTTDLPHLGQPTEQTPLPPKLPKPLLSEPILLEDYATPFEIGGAAAEQMIQPDTNKVLRIESRRTRRDDDPTPPSSPSKQRSNIRKLNSVSRGNASDQQGASSQNDYRVKQPRSVQPKNAQDIAVTLGFDTAQPIIGLDFGTSYCRSADGDSTIVAVPLEGDAPFLPSVVSFPSPDSVIIGAEARARMAGEAQWTVVSPKRLLGRPYADPQIEAALGTLALRTFAGTDRFIRFEAHGVVYSASDLCALLLKNVRERACSYLNKKIFQAVVGVPVGFGTLQRSALELAARDAGFRRIAFIAEPVAALLAQQIRPCAGLTAVFDFGGGTFDFCLVDVTETAFNVICAGGDSWLGGDDFDLALASLVADRFWRDEKIDLRNRVVEWQALLHACELAKRRLSEQMETVVKIDDLIAKNQGSSGLRQKVSREEFDSISVNLIERSLIVVDRVMAQAKVERQNLVNVVVTGGTSRIPAVRAAVQAYFKKTPVIADPDLSVVRGTAIRAAQFRGLKNPNIPRQRLFDVAGRAIGASLPEGRVLTVFERNTPLPAQRRHTFYCDSSDSDIVLVLYESSQSRIDQSQVLGRLSYRGLKPSASKQCQVDVTFKLDHDGMLHVTADNGEQSAEKSIHLQR